MPFLRTVSVFLAFTAGLLCFFIFFYHFLNVVAGVKPERKSLAPFLGPLVFIWPGLLNDIAKRSRTLMIVYFLLFLLFMGLFVGIGEFWPR